MKSDRDRLKRRLNAIPKEARKTIRRALEESAHQIADTAYLYAPADDGDLRRSIGYTFGRYKAENANVRGVSGGASLGDPDLSVTVHAGDAKAFYAAFVEFGTAPHVIAPKKLGGSLFFNGSGIQSVQHPGSAARPFFYPAYRTNKKRAVSRIARATKKAAKDAAKTS